MKHSLHMSLDKMGVTFLNDRPLSVFRITEITKIATLILGYNCAYILGYPLNHKPLTLSYASIQYHWFPYRGICSCIGRKNVEFEERKSIYTVHTVGCKLHNFLALKYEWITDLIEQTYHQFSSWCKTTTVK